MKKKIIAAFLATTMAFTSVSFNVFAEDAAVEAEDISDDLESDSDEPAQITDEQETDESGEISDEQEIDETDDIDKASDDEANYINNEVPIGRPAEFKTEELLNDIVSSSAITLDSAVTEGWGNVLVGGVKDDKTGDVFFTIDGDLSKVTITPTKEKKGKWSGGSDEFAGLGTTIDTSKDFDFTADIVIDEMNVLGGASATPQQSSAGIAIMQNLKDKLQPSVAVSLFASGSKDEYANFYGSYRDQSGVSNKKRTGNEPLSEKTIALVGGKDSKSFALKISKRGNIYTVYCGDNSYIVRDAGNIFSGNTISPVVFAARQCKATFSNVKLEIPDKEVKSIEITKMPDSTEFIQKNWPTLDGIEVKAVYSDDSEEVLQKGDYGVDVDINTIGSQTAKIVKGGKSADIQLSCVKNRVTKLTLDSKIIKNEYFVGQKFKPEGIAVTADFLDGSQKALADTEYEFSINGKPVDSNTFIDDDMIKANEVKINFSKDNEDIEWGGVYASNPVTMHEGYKIKSISLEATPIKKVYYDTDKGFEPEGMRIKATYTNGAGSDMTDILADNEYIIDTKTSNFESFDAEGNLIAEPFKNKPEGTYKIDIKYAYDNNIQAIFNATLVIRKLLQFKMTGYPVTTYQINSGSPKSVFDRTGMEGSYVYSSGEQDVVPLRKIIYAAGDEEIVDENGLYDVDLTKFSVSQASSSDNPTSFINIIPVDRQLSDISLPVTVKQVNPHFWKATYFGESTSAANDKITGNIEDIENNGTATISSLNKGGKLSTDQDGIAFLYTRVSKEDNFRISADIKVTKYLDGDSFDDTKRAGQEGFGIMARDNIMLKNAADGEITADAATAEKDANGEPVPLNRGTVFAGNFVMVGGCSFTGYPTDKTATSYEKNRDINRINLALRRDAQSWRTSDVGSPTREIIGSLSDNMFQKDDMYHLTLEKINGGYKATCYDYQTKKTSSRTYPSSQGILNTIDPDNIYVGFFAARLAEIEVSNVYFNITEPKTDIIALDKNVTSVVPRISVTSEEFSKTTNYNLVVSASNASGGYLTIKQDDKIIINNKSVLNGSNVFPVKINSDSQTNFTLYYTPRYISEDNPDYEELTSYDMVSESFTVTHKGNYNESDVIYVAPTADGSYVPKVEGSFDGDGTRAKPYDIDTALGFVERGQTIVMMDGIYYRDKTITISELKSGTLNQPINLIADEGAEPVFDMKGKVLGMTLAASLWNLKGIDFRNSGKNLRGFQLSGDYCVIEDCKFYDNNDTGFQLSRTNNSANSILSWPHNNLIKNCEVWNSHDPSGINADGFGCKLTVGNGNRFEGCISHHNLDDGWDLYTKSGSGPIGVVTLDNCISYQQGYQLLEDGTTASELWNKTAGHNGLKLGGEGVAVQHIIRNCKTFMNGADGISSNSNPQLTARDCVSYNNEKRNVALYSDTKDKLNYDLKGVVSYKTTSADRVDGYKHDKNYNYLALDSKDESKNAAGSVVNETFFKSLDMDSVIKNGHYAQNPDGSFITGDFLELTDAVKSSIKNDPDYEDKETSTEATTSSSKGHYSASVGGGGSSKRGNSASSSSASSGSSLISSNKTNSDKSDANSGTQTDDKTNNTQTDDKSNNTQTGDKTNNTQTDDKSNNTQTDNKANDAQTRDSDNKGNVAAQNADNFTDLKGSWAKPYVSALVDKGIISGINDTTFAPSAAITRGDFTKMLIKALGVTSDTPHGFSDVNSTDYYNAEIAAAKAYGIVNGTSSTTFEPKSNITRQDAVTIIARAIDTLGADTSSVGDLSKFADSAAIAAYAVAPFEKLVGLGFVNGTDGNINPVSKITRAEAAKLIYDLLSLKSDK